MPVASFNVVTRLENLSVTLGGRAGKRPWPSASHLTSCQALCIPSHIPCSLHSILSAASYLHCCYYATHSTLLPYCLPPYWPTVPCHVTATPISHTIHLSSPLPDLAGFPPPCSILHDYAPVDCITNMTTQCVAAVIPLCHPYLLSSWSLILSWLSQTPPSCLCSLLPSLPFSHMLLPSTYVNHHPPHGAIPYLYHLW